MFLKKNNKLLNLKLKISDADTKNVSSNIDHHITNGGHSKSVCSCSINKNKIIFKNNLFIKKEVNPCFLCINDSKSSPLKVIFKIKKITENVINNNQNTVQEH